MTKLIGLLATCALVLAVAPAFAQQIERAQVQRLPQAQVAKRPPVIAQQVRPITPVTPAAPKTSGTVAVAANAGWVPTGITVQKGGQIDIAARGAWSLGGASLAAATAVVMLNADGAPNTAGPGTPLPTANRGALIGRIGDGAPFLIGTRFSGVAPADGVLFATINESPNALRDNQGTMSAVIRTAAPAVTPPTRTPPSRDPPSRDPPTTKPPETAPPATAPPTRVPPTRDPPTRDPPTTKPPETREPTTPTQPPVTEPPVGKPPVIEPTPQDQTPPPDAGQTPPVVEQPLPPPADAPPVEPTPLPVDDAAPPTPPASAPVIPVVPLAIGAAVLAGLLLLGGLFRPRRKPGGDDDTHNAGAAPRVSARVVSDGIAGQSLTITERTR